MKFRQGILWVNLARGWKAAVFRVRVWAPEWFSRVSWVPFEVSIPGELSHLLSHLAQKGCGQSTRQGHRNDSFVGNMGDLEQSNSYLQLALSPNSVQVQAAHLSKDFQGGLEDVSLASSPAWKLFPQIPNHPGSGPCYVTLWGHIAPPLWGI